MQIEQGECQGRTVLRVMGQLDAVSAPNFKRSSEAVIAAGQYAIVLDMSEVELMDSSGVGAVVSLFKKARVGQGDVKIAGLSGQPLEIFKLLRLDRAFELASSVEAAAAQFDAS